MLKGELKNILHNRKMLIAIIAVLLVPVLYAGMLLWAFWDPYDRLPDLPVAVVNADKGADFEGRQLDIGNEVTDKLMESKEFNFIEMTPEEGEKALDGHDVYMLIEFPSNFSEHATTLLDEQPEKLSIEYRPNEGLNFLSGQIGETAMEKIRSEVNEQIVAVYSEQLFDAIAEMGDGFGEASDGAGQLEDGAKELHNGASDLKGYLEQLAGGSLELVDGTDRLVAGTSEAAQGAGKLDEGLSALSAGSGRLRSGADEAANGAAALKSGVQEYTAGVSRLKEGIAAANSKDGDLIAALGQLKSGASRVDGSVGELETGAGQVHQGIEALAGQLEPILKQLSPEQQAQLNGTLEQLKQGSGAVSAGLSSLGEGTGSLAAGIGEAESGAGQLAEARKQIQAGAAELDGSSAKLVEGAGSLAAGNAQLASGAAELDAGIQSANEGSRSLASGLGSLLEGSGQLKAGTSELAQKSGELASGSGKLVSGTEELADGSGTLREKLADAHDTAGGVKANDDTIDMASAPVQVEKDSIDHVPNYGTGFTPYFLSLGLFVGALLITIVFPLVEPAVRPVNGWRWAGSKIAILAVVGLIQALAAVAVVIMALGLDAVEPGWLIASAIITSYTFLAIVQFLVSSMGDPGRFIAIILLVLQLTTSAGTFPLELIPEPLQWLNAGLPMTYSVQAFKAAISSGNADLALFSNGILLAFMAGALILTVTYFTVLFKRRYSKLAEA
ncbi:YhgE/Pip domain-containing protein [Edaphobacillus lindanitolerans]|uniref:Putative membrane protein n=1 Tax=Edaphobacillus lindanitolerans TaxID=550447 RepID=A0A1U7PQI6_9BACI|nr:YhgE/Pip domain-containing protein [Edaphobacillus lindanitolerans]SIT83980.1 putative membrane protein [Edaphobacillus lindanitolerans]